MVPEFESRRGFATTFLRFDFSDFERENPARQTRTRQARRIIFKNAFLFCRLNRKRCICRRA